MASDASGMPIGTRIRKRRQELDLTQEEMAERVGVHPSTIINWEKGRHFPQRYLGKVEAVLGIRLEGPDAEPEIPPEIRRRVAAMTPREREWVRAWLTDLIRREGRANGGEDPPQAAQV